MNDILKDPYDLVAEALNIEKELLSEESCIGKTLNWDSLNQVSIIIEIESSYGIKIKDDEITKYENMKAIIELYKTLTHDSDNAC